MPNKTYEMRNLYFQQSPYSAEQAKPDYPLFLQWPDKGYFEKFKPDADLLQKALSPLEKSVTNSIADQVFGNLKEIEYLDLKHSANLFYERCRLHKQHIQEIDRRHIEIQGRKFGVEINNFPDKARRLSNLEGQLVNGGVKVYHLAEQKYTTGSLYSRDRPGCQYSILTSSFLPPG